ncbi:MAG: Ig-like domain-containing protein [Candidatus Marinimicrobia bacterium]|nr:Ig-like domain-containing protein [Candidatus Neomarinimicrobiota bacterium]
MKTPFFSMFLLLAGSLLITQCAAEKPPGGGPPDKQPPSLISASLPDGAVNVDSLHTLRFIFSEPLLVKTAENNITLFPLDRTGTDIRIRGRKIQIRPLTPWERGTVYTLILGKNIADLRNNSLPEPLQFSFTRSGVMPQNSIRGYVAEQDGNVNTSICISRQHRVPDSIFAQPEYFTQSASGGAFTFDHLPEDTFFIAGYQDMDRSNSFHQDLDGVCVPSEPAVLPDTLDHHNVVLLATKDNFLPPELVKADNLYPGATELSFTKKPAAWNRRESFQISEAEVDTVIYAGKTCTLYHDRLSDDSLEMKLRGVVDYLSCALHDTLAHLPVKNPEDSLYHFEQRGTSLFITPPPDAWELKGRFEGLRDTLELTLIKQKHAIYAIPVLAASDRGKWHVHMPASATYPEIRTDSLYAVDLQPKAAPNTAPSQDVSRRRKCIRPCGWS